jgi:phosphinothricin acetyltransferase
MEIIIRSAVFSDLDTILEITNHQILNSTSIYDYEPRDFETEKAWFDKKSVDNFPVIVAEFENGIIGYATFDTFRQKEAFKYTVEHSLYVAEAFIGKGVGKLLLAELIKLAQKQKFHTMIGVIDSENLNSITFHEKFGFKKVGIIKESAYKFDRWLDSALFQLML